MDDEDDEVGGEARGTGTSACMVAHGAMRVTRAVNEGSSWMSWHCLRGYWRRRSHWQLRSVNGKAAVFDSGGRDAGTPWRGR